MWAADAADGAAGRGNNKKLQSRAKMDAAGVAGGWIRSLVRVVQPVADAASVADDAVGALAVARVRVAFTVEALLAAGNALRDAPQAVRAAARVNVVLPDGRELLRPGAVMNPAARGERCGPRGLLLRPPRPAAGRHAAPLQRRPTRRQLPSSPGPP